MEFLAGEGANYGYRKLTLLLRRRHHLIINKKKVYRLCKRMNVLRLQRKIKFKHPKRLANNREITGSNQLWETDSLREEIKRLIEQRNALKEGNLELYNKLTQLDF